MKRFLSFVGILLCVGSFAYAEKSVLIDFNDLGNDSNGQNSATTMSFAGSAPSYISQEEKDKMVTSLFIDNWRAQYNYSARSLKRTHLTRIVAVTSNELGKTVMGVRLVFPEGANNANATIVPPFKIHSIAPEDQHGQKGRFENKGVIKNVGTIKQISVNVRGLAYPHKFALLFEDGQGRLHEVSMGCLNYRGWKTLTWTNPNYVYDVRNLDYTNKPTYPIDSHFMRFVGFKVYRFMNNNIAGDFITYISDITVTYDKAIEDSDNQDIDDEAVWSILAAREQTCLQREMERFGERQFFEYRKQKLHDETTSNVYPADGYIKSPSSAVLGAENAQATKDNAQTNRAQ